MFGQLRRLKRFDKDDIIALEGYKAEECFILIRGRVGVFKNDILIAEFSEKGDLFGELSIILEQPRTATLVALEETDLACIKLKIDELLDYYPSVVKKIMQNLAERLAITTDDYLTSVTLLESELTRISNNSDIRK